jgi:NADH-quinone oxidoreductase subunit J
MLYLYFLISSLAITSSIIVISARNPIHSVLALISVILNVVFLMFLLEAEFLALMFIGVYLGAVTVLFLFIVMMLNIKAIDFSKEVLYSLPVGSFFGFIFIYLLYFISSDSVGVSNSSSLFFNFDFFDWKAIMENVVNIDVFGSLLYTHYAPFLLIVGVVLLIAMIGAIILTKTNYVLSGQKRNFIDQQVTRNFENAVFLVNEKKRFN